MATAASIIEVKTGGGAGGRKCLVIGDIGDWIGGCNHMDNARTHMGEVDKSPDQGRGRGRCTPPLARKRRMVDGFTVITMGMVVMTSSREEIGVGVTVTVRGMARADIGARVTVELERSVPRGDGVALHILTGVMSLIDVLIKRQYF